MKIKIPIMKTIQETGKMFNIAPYGIRQLVFSKKIRYVKLGTKYMINIQSLIDYLNKGDIEKNISTENSKIRKVG